VHIRRDLQAQVLETQGREGALLCERTIQNRRSAQCRNDHLPGSIADDALRASRRDPVAGAHVNDEEFDKVTAVEVPPRAGRREWIGLAVLALACVLYVMDLTVLYLAIPAISADLEPTSAQLLWIIDIYGFFVAGSLITMGTLGDRVGRRRLLMIGATAFGLVSILAAWSSTAEWLIVSRALLGIAGATLAPRPCR